MKIISTYGKHNQWMIELLLNVKPFQVKIDTGVVGVTAISEETLETGWSHFKRNR